MKKTIQVIIALIVIFNVCVITVSAKNISESTAESNLLGITDEEMSIVNPDNQYYVLKIYSIVAIFDFAEDMTIDEMVDPNRIVPYFLITENYVEYYTRRCWIDNGKIKYDQNQHDFYMDWQIEFINDWPNILKNASLTKDVYDSIQVTQIYFLSPSHYFEFGSVLYLVTNLGDYICYREPYPSTDYYLMSVDDFRSIAMLTVEELSKLNGISMGSVAITQFTDISSYKVEIKESADTSPSTNENETGTISETNNTEITTIEDINQEMQIEGQNDTVNIHNSDISGCNSSITSISVIIPMAICIVTLNRKKKINV